MIFDRNEKKQVVALLGAGSMGTAIVRRIAAGKKILLGDISEKALERVSDDFRRSGYDVETCVVNALERESIEAFAKKAAELGPVMYFIDTAGASPNQASPEHIVALDMVGTGYAVDAFGRVMAEGGAGLIISSQAAYMYPIPNEDELQIVNAATEQLSENNPKSSAVFTEMRQNFRNFAALKRTTDDYKREIQTYLHIDGIGHYTAVQAYAECDADVLSR